MEPGLHRPTHEEVMSNASPFLSIPANQLQAVTVAEELKDQLRNRQEVMVVPSCMMCEELRQGSWVFQIMQHLPLIEEAA